MSSTPRPIPVGLPPVKVWVEFTPPEPTVIELQGPALRAYYRWLEEADDASEEWLEEKIYEQCENHVVLWSRLKDWDRED